jgi:hypothetical protein
MSLSINICHPSFPTEEVIYKSKKVSMDYEIRKNNKTIKNIYYREISHLSKKKF